MPNWTIDLPPTNTTLIDCSRLDYLLIVQAKADLAVLEEKYRITTLMAAGQS